MIFLIDQQLPLSLARWIAAQGQEAFHVREIGLELAEDHEIWREACARNATIISKDADFIGISRIRPGQPVVWIRFGNCTNALLMQRFAAIWPQVIAELENGATLIELQ